MTTTSQTRSRRAFPPAPREANALLITCHPYRDSFNNALAEAWTDGARETGVTTTTIHLPDLEFDPVLHVAYREDQALEPDLQRVRDALAESAHVSLAFPIWWGSTPATLKGLLDRVLLPGWAFEFAGAKFPRPGLAGRSARLITTMDSPSWYDRLVYGAAARRQVGRATLRFCGIKPVRYSCFGSVGNATSKRRAGMLRQAQAAGTKDARRLLRRLQQEPTTQVAPSRL